MELEMTIFGLWLWDNRDNMMSSLLPKSIEGKIIIICPACPMAYVCMLLRFKHGGVWA